MFTVAGCILFTAVSVLGVEDFLLGGGSVAASYSTCRLEGGTSGASLGTEVGKVVLLLLLWMLLPF